MVRLLIQFPLLLAVVDATVLSQQHVLAPALLQTRDETFGGDTPVTRVVKLLEAMKATLKKEMDEDKTLHGKLRCWCHDNKYEKDNSISEGQTKISELESTIETLSAQGKEFAAKLEATEKDVADNKNALAEAQALRNKQLEAFNGDERDSIQALENLKAALVVLSKHHDTAFPQLSFLSMSSKDEPFSEDGHPTQKFLQQQESAWSTEEVGVVRRAMQSASAVLRAHESYIPSYSAQSGEIMGVLKQLQSEMENGLSDSQKSETERAALFASLRAEKMEEIKQGEKRAEQLEDAKATNSNDLAEAKEDLGQAQAKLSEDQKFATNLANTCGEADKNFDLRTSSRLEEITAVSEAIGILTADNARDAMTGTFNFMQLTTHTHVHRDSRQKRAAAALRKAAAKSSSPELAMLASTVELDAFTRVKRVINDMIEKLRLQQADEVKKNDYCTAEFHSNEMSTASANDLRVDQETNIATLADKAKRLETEIGQAKVDIENLRRELQRLTENRYNENIEFQASVKDQTETVSVLLVALDRLAKFYDASLVQAGTADHQTPPLPQMKYEKNSGSSGVMSMLEKLVHETKALREESRAAENEAQKGYEESVAITNTGVKDLETQIASKTQTKARTHKELQQANLDLADTKKELDGLAKYNADLHAECDYVQQNFDIRQKARAEEIEALQQAIQILSGADLS